MYLFIDTSERDRINLTLFGQKKNINESFATPKSQSEKLLFLINQFLSENKINLKAIKGIAVVNKGGSFSSVRLACAAANSLAFCLKIPIVSVKINKRENVSNILKNSEKRLKKLSVFNLNKLVLPEYDKAPNITVKKLKNNDKQK